MQNKGIIKFLVALLVIVCVYELSFTYMTKKIEREVRAEVGDDYEAYAAAIKERDQEIVWMGYTFKEVKQREINLGLDLRGGVSVTLEISMEELIRSVAESNAKSPEFKAVEKRATELYKSQSGTYIEHFYTAFKELQKGTPLVTWFITRDSDFTEDTPDDKVISILNDYASEAIDQANQVLRERVKQFGIAQPDIRKLGNTGRIMVDLPGVNDIQRVRNLLQGSANLQFWDVYPIYELAEELIDAAEYYDQQFYAKELANKDTLTQDSLSELTAQNTWTNPIRDAVQGLQNGYNFYTPVRTSDTSKVNQFFASKVGGNILKNRFEIAWDANANNLETGSTVFLYFLVKDRYGKPLMEGDIIKYARADFNPENGQKVVSLDFKSNFVSPWEKITRDAFEDKKPIAIVLDGVVYSAPVVTDGPISSGSTQISGGRNDNQYWNRDLANVLNAGKFPAPAKIVEESIVGPTLGQEAIQAGVLSFIIALLVVLVYMIFYYSTAGWVSNVALLANIFFIIGALASFPTISLTLPGVAGIVLTVGMSVDANVLIYERIREELRLGKSIKLAISDGYKNAYTAILDANITTLITGIILWYFGTGVIESFAQTLVVGIFTSLFSAIFITRIIFDSLLKRDKSIQFGSSLTSNLLANTKISFVNNRRKLYLLSIIVVIIGAGAILGKGFDLGTDFSGGRTYKVNLLENPGEETIKNTLAEYFIDDNGEVSSAEVKAVKGGNTLIITTKYLYNDNTIDASEKAEIALFEGIRAYLPSDMDFNAFKAQSNDKNLGLMQSYVVGPTIADDIIKSAVQSIILALLAIFIYVALRFRKWQYGLGALVAIFHDVIIVLGIFSLLSGLMPFSMEINQAFVAAILTVVGYSINDTVVVFDRIREVMLGNKKMSQQEVIDSALNSTLSRTFNTSITIFVVLLSILIFGGESIQGFAFALLIGVVVGTYSSLYIAAPFYYDLVRKELDK